MDKYGDVDIYPIACLDEILDYLAANTITSNYDIGILDDPSKNYICCAISLKSSFSGNPIIPFIFYVKKEE